MKNLEQGKATICIVNYKTERLTRLCLRSIRKFTKYPYNVIVVDNNSDDASLDYLRSLKWIKLIERKASDDIRSGSWAHGSGLDSGLEICNTEFFVAMHSDVIIRDPQWLNYLANFAENDPKVGCVGSGKIEDKPEWLLALRRATDIKALIRKITGTKDERFYVRAICSLYRTEPLLKHGLRFAADSDKGVTCGKKLYFELLRLGYASIEIPSATMTKMIWHLAHATMVLNPEFKVRKRTEEKCKRKLFEILESPLVQELEQNGAKYDE